MPVVAAEPPVTLDAQLAAANQPLDVPRGGASRCTLKRRLLDSVARPLGAWLGPRGSRAFGILMYHRVTQAVDGFPPPTWNVTPQRLEEQLSGLLARGWHCWPLARVLACREKSLPIPRKTFVVTFDDGFANNWLNAYPTLWRLQIPATLFLATAYLDSPRPFPSDDWSAAGAPGAPDSAWRPLTTEECRRLVADGLVELGAHTHTHADFRGRPAALVADLRENLLVLRERFGVERPPFAFPYGTKADGFVSDQLIAAARGVGVTCCLTTVEDVVLPGDSPFDWGRFGPDELDDAASLAAQLGGWQVALRRAGRRILGRHSGSIAPKT